MNDFLDHVDYAAKLVGPEHLAIGTDYKLDSLSSFERLRLISAIAAFLEALRQGDERLTAAG